MDDHSPLEAIFFAALEKGSPEERAAYVDAACAGDPDLRRRVEKMISAQLQAGSFLERPAGSPVMTVDQQPADAGPGTVIGPYKLLQQIGEGGMGTVYMAEQSAPVQRRVALKLIKPGMDSRQVIARFEAERQALALMDHPNIAKVLDAGTTDTGRPYFVMELVKGVPITRYCDDHHLTPRQRLELFMPVCAAVQHAHQKGIIHRDMKPSNVLVCIYDGRPVPKVIDFGVAKATGPKLTDRTLFTEFGSIVGTVEYMSPEQAQLDQLDVDTRSDVYSLGVLLYELLTGTTPLEHKRLTQVAVLELLRLVREEEAPRPSTRLSTADGLPSIAANRGTEPKKLSGLMRGELDWIVLKALEKDRNRRYETANGFAADVQRYLHDETVLACPPSAGYRLRKFARRNRVGLAAATGVAVAVLAGLGVSTWQAVRATRAEGLAADRLTAEVAAGERAKADEARAVSEARRATAVADLLQQMLASANPEVAQKAGMTVRDLLEAFSAGLGDQLKDQPEVEATVRQVIGRAYWRLNRHPSRTGRCSAPRDARDRPAAAGREPGGLGPGGLRAEAIRPRAARPGGGPRPAAAGRRAPPPGHRDHGLAPDADLVRRAGWREAGGRGGPAGGGGPGAGPRSARRG
jgi:serine/threonine protein kinase